MAGLENRKARHEYEILETYEAGLVLLGTEVKSIRASQVDFSGTFARFHQNELFLESLYIGPYDKAGISNHVALRTRKLLLSRRELNKLRIEVEHKRLTVVPLKIYFNERGKAKVLLALAKGKRDYEKRSDDKKRDVSRQLEGW